MILGKTLGYDLEPALANIEISLTFHDRVNDLVMVQFQGQSKLHKRNWNRRTERNLYRIYRHVFSKKP